MQSTFVRELEIPISEPNNVVPHLMHTFSPTTVRTSKLHRMDHESQIKAAIIDLESQERVNYYVTAKK
jgi:hypothetical protein